MCKHLKYVRLHPKSSFALLTFCFPKSFATFIFSLSYFTRGIPTPARVVQQSEIFFVNYVFVIARFSVQRFCELAFISSSSVSRKRTRERGKENIGGEMVWDTSAVRWENAQTTPQPNRKRVLLRIDFSVRSPITRARSQESAIAPQSLGKRFGFLAKVPLTHLRWPLSFFSCSAPFFLLAFPLSLPLFSFRQRARKYNASDRINRCLSCRVHCDRNGGWDLLAVFIECARNHCSSRLL